MKFIICNTGQPERKGVWVLEHGLYNKWQRQESSLSTCCPTAWVSVDVLVLGDVPVWRCPCTWTWTQAWELWRALEVSEGLVRRFQECGSVWWHSRDENWGEARPWNPSSTVAVSSEEFSIRSRASWSNISKVALSGCVALGQKLGEGDN